MLQMKRYNLTYLLVILLIVVYQIPGTAQTRYIQKTVDVVIPTVLDLTLASGPNPIADFNTTAKMDAGITLLNQTIFNYKSNKSWFVTIQTNTASFSGGVAGNSVPVSVIKYRLNSTGGTYTPLSTVASPLAGTSASKLSRGTGSNGVDFFIDPGYIYAPAQDYTVQIIYTISNL
jgi:hypothetical protein